MQRDFESVGIASSLLSKHYDFIGFPAGPGLLSSIYNSLMDHFANVGYIRLCSVGHPRSSRLVCGIWYESKPLEMLWSSGTAGVQLHPSLSTEKGHIFLLGFETVRVLRYRQQRGFGSQQMVPGKQVLWDEQQLEQGGDTPQSKLFCIWAVTFLIMFSPGL